MNIINRNIPDCRADNDNIGRRLSLPVSKVFGFPKKVRTNRSNSEAW